MVISLPPVGASSLSGQRRDALGDEVHAEDEEQHCHHSSFVHGEPFLRRVELDLRAVAAGEVEDDWADPTPAAKRGFLELTPASSRASPSALAGANASMSAIRLGICGSVPALPI
jgi:hypothetical protein